MVSGGGISPTVSDDSSGAEISDKEKKVVKVEEKVKKKKRKRNALIEDEASEDSSEEDEEKPKKKSQKAKKDKKKKKKSKRENDEGDDEEEVDKDDEEDDSSDEGEDNNEYEEDGFVVDDDAEGSSEEDTDRHHSRRRKRKKEKKLKRLKQKKEDELDDEDLALIKENLGLDTGPLRALDDDDSDGDDDQHRPSSSKKRKKKKRSSDDDSMDEDNDGSTKINRELSRQMFGDSDDEDDEEDRSRIKANKRGGHDFDDIDGEYESDDIDEFIVDDGGEEDGGSRRRRKKRNQPLQPMMEGPSVYQMDEAEELFGDMNDFMEATRGSVSAKKNEEDDDETDANDEGRDGDTSSSLSKDRFSSKKKKLLKKYEPIVLEEHMMTTEAENIRENDIPERYQYLYANSCRVDNEWSQDPEERVEEAEWICDTLLSSIEKKIGGKASRGEVVSSIDDVLKFYHEDKLEFPYIQRYCKEHWKYAQLSSSHILEIIELDEKWFKLDQKKKSLLKMLSRVAAGVSTTSSQKNIADSDEVKKKDNNSTTSFASSALLSSDSWLSVYEKDLKSRKMEESQLRDLANFLALDFSAKDDCISAAVGENRKIFRRPQRRDFYRICVRAGLRKMTRMFTLPATVFGCKLLCSETDGNKEATALAAASSSAVATDGSEVVVDDVEGGTVVVNPLLAIEVPRPNRLNNGSNQSPGELAKDFANSEFPLEEDVLKGARHIAACEVANEPHVRQFVRQLYYRGAKLFTEATVKGVEEIDEFHVCHGLQYLDSMPVQELFEQPSDLFAKIARAEKENFLTITISYENSQTLLEPLAKYYLVQKDGTMQMDDEEEEWENQRRQILQEAIASILLPSLEKELYVELLRRSRDVLTKAVGRALKNEIMIRPYEPRDQVDPCVVGIWVDLSGARECPVYVVALDDNGEVCDKLIGLCVRQNDQVVELTNQLRDFFLANENVHIVGINTSAGMKCMDMGEIVDNVREKLGRQNVDNYGRNNGRNYMHLTFVKDELARIYSRSKRADLEFPNEPEGFRAAVSLGRWIQNPLSEYCSLWGSVPLSDPERGQELLNLNLHPLQRYLTKEVLLAEFQRTFVDVVNRVGIDLNLCANHRHAQSQLQFVCGVGPIKAQHLIQRIRHQNRIDNRQELLSKSMVGRTIYRNMAGFVRIRERDTLKDVPLNALDDTRIHPESYYMAVKICADANNNTAMDLYDPVQYALVVENTMFASMKEIKSKEQERLQKLDQHHQSNRYDDQNPQRNHYDYINLKRFEDNSSNSSNTTNSLQDPLSELDLDAYASRLSKEGKGMKLLTLNLIKQELRYPFFDKRCPYFDPRDEDLFFLLNGETRDTLRKGMILPCQLLNEAGRDYIRVRMESGIRATLRREQLPDYMTKNEDMYLNTHGFPSGLTVNVKVLNFVTDRMNRYSLSIGADNQSLQDVRMCFNRNDFCPYTIIPRVIQDSTVRIDKLLNFEPLSQAGQQQQSNVDVINGGTANLKSFGQKRKKRQIAHPAYQNVNCNGAIAFLKDQPIGESLLRPSSVGHDHLTLTWKMYTGVFRHFDILELEKPSETRLGKKLVIKNQTYEDIDELIARFIGPMNELVDEVISHKNFRMGSREQVEAELIEEKKAKPQRIPYFLHLYDRFPGCFSISFIARTTPRACHLEVKPQGFRFFSGIDSGILPNFKSVLLYFKMNVLTPPNKKATIPLPSSDPNSSRNRIKGSHHRSSTHILNSNTTKNTMMNQQNTYGRDRGRWQDPPSSGRNAPSHYGDAESRGNVREYGRDRYDSRVGSDRIYSSHNRYNDDNVGRPPYNHQQQMNNNNPRGGHYGGSNNYTNNQRR